MLLLTFEARNEANSEANEANHEVNSDSIQNRILELVRENSQITQAELAKQIGVSRATIQRYMKIMLENKKISRIGSTRGYWKINEE